MALKWLRDQFKHLKIILWAVVAVFILLVFVDWGAGRSGSRGGSGSFAVRVDNTGLSQQEFLRRLGNMDDQYRSRFGEQWEELKKQVNLPSQVVNQFVQSELLAKEARRVGIVVTDEEINQTVHARFEYKGKFVGRERFEGYVKRTLGISPQKYVQLVRNELMISKLQEMTVKGIYVSDADAEYEVRKNSEVADIAVVQIPYEQFLGGLDVNDSERQEYYQQHQEEFRQPEKRSVRYLLVDTSKLRRTLPVDDEEIAAFYEANRADFMEGEQAHARHVLIRLAPGASPTEQAEAEMKARSVASLAKSGVDFAELAKKHSEDPGSKDNGGELGWFGRGEMVKSFEDAVFGAKPGEIVGPIKSEHGYHIIKVEGFKPATQKPLEEVREQVRFRLLEGRASAEAEARARALHARLQQEKPVTSEEWQAIADGDDAVVLNVSPPFTQDGIVEGIGNNPVFTAAVFDAKINDIGEAMAISRGWMVWQLAEIQPAGVPPLEEVAVQVDQRILQSKAQDKAAQRAAELAQQWRDGADPNSLAQSVGSSVVDAPNHRRGQSITGLGSVYALDRVVFTAAPGEVVGPVSLAEHGVVIARVDTLQLVSDDELATQLEQTRESLKEQRAEQLMMAILNELRRDTVITIDTELMDKYGPQQG